MNQHRNFVAPGATRVTPRAAETSSTSRKSLVIGRAIIAGFGFAIVIGIYLSSIFGWIAGIILGWIAGNILTLGFAYLWFRLDRARQIRLRANERHMREMSIEQQHWMA